MRRERELKKVQTDRQTNRQQTTGKEGKRPRNPIGDMEREGEKACDLVFFELRLSTIKRAKKRKERERKIVYFSLPSKRALRLFQRLEVPGIIKVISKSEVCRALFDAEKVFQIFSMYI